MPDPTVPPVPESRAVPRKQTRLSAVWLVPIIAALAGAWVAVTRIMNEGPKIKRFMPAAQGRATPIQKRTSHVEIVIGAKEGK